MNDSKVKILISYHKPSVLLKDDVLTPIHVGRAIATEASKDGSMSEEDYKWMLDNMIGDDTGDNISYLNRTVNELTAIYWAWKNYDKLGNPDYIGFMHYRRIFDFFNQSGSLPNHPILNLPVLDIIDDNFLSFYSGENIINIIKNNNYIISKHHKGNPYNHYKTASKYLHIEDYDKCLDIISKYQTKYKEAADSYNNGDKCYFTNMFILQKGDFFEYCEFLFYVILDYIKSINYNKYSFQESRTYMSEWLTAIYFQYLETNRNIIINEIQSIYIENTNITEELQPKKENSIRICFSSNDLYSLYLIVTLQSLIDNSNKNNYYEIYILETNISQYNKNRILDMMSDNIYIKFIRVSDYIKDIDKINFFVSRHFSIETYYRFFISKIFKNFNKILYLDVDIIILDDVFKLYNTSMSYPIAVVLDIEISRSLYTKSILSNKNISFEKYLRNELKLENPNNYFQAGIILFDIKKCIEFDLEKKCLQKLIDIKEPITVDQDILNAVCENNVNFLDLSWNVEWMLAVYYNNLSDMLPVKYYNEYIKAYNNPKIIHYCDGIKPWNLPYLSKAEIWWQYARKTKYYEEILFRMVQNERYWDMKSNPIQYKDILNIQNNKRKNIFDYVFSIEKNEQYKIITILGIKITLKINK